MPAERDSHVVAKQTTLRAPPGSCERRLDVVDAAPPRHERIKVKQATATGLSYHLTVI